MWTLLRPLGYLSDEPASRGDGFARRSPWAKRTRLAVETLESRNLCSVGGHQLVALPSVHHHAEVRTLLTQTIHPARLVGAMPSFHLQAARRQRSFSIGQENRFLPGKWVVTYDASSLFGPGAVGGQEITFTGPKGAKTFISTTGVSVPGYFGRAYYQFSSWGTYQFLSKNLVRLTITGGSPTEYLNNGIIVMGGQFMPIQFQNSNQFVVQGQVYNREPLGSTIFNA